MQEDKDKSNHQEDAGGGGGGGGGEMKGKTWEQSFLSFPLDKQGQQDIPIPMSLQPTNITGIPTTAFSLTASSASAEVITPGYGEVISTAVALDMEHILVGIHEQGGEVVVAFSHAQLSYIPLVHLGSRETIQLIGDLRWALQRLENSLPSAPSIPPME